MLRSDTFSNRLRHTLQVRASSSSTSREEGDAGVDPSSEFLLSWFLLLGAGGVLLDCWLSVSAFLTLWAMKQWRDKEEADVKHAPHCRHCRTLLSGPPGWCWLMCSKNSALSSVKKPQGAQRKPDSGWEEDAGTEEDFFAGLNPSVVSLPSSSFTAALCLRRALTLVSCSDELSASSLPSCNKK